jgi:cell division septum initiation protein DivIVA
MPFRRQERVSPLQQARRTAETQARHLAEIAEAQARQLAGSAEMQARQIVEAVEQRLPGRRRTPWYARTWAKSLFGALAVGLGLALAAAFVARQRMSEAMAEQNATDERGLASTRTEEYDANRAEGDGIENVQRAAEDGGVDNVQEASKESFPASDPPVWGSGPDVPVIRQGEHKETLPYQR